MTHRAPAVCWMTDLWPEAMEATGVRLSPAVRGGIRRLEDAVYRSLSVICVNSPGLKRKLIEKGVPESKLDVIVDWADEGIFRPAAAEAELARSVGMAGKFNVVYGGNFGPAQGLETAIDAAALLGDMPDFQLVLIGDGEQTTQLRNKVAKLGLGNVLFVPRQPMGEMHRYFALAQVLLIHLTAHPLFELQIPSKTMAYLACGRPILCAVSGEAAAVVREAGAGVCTPPGDAEAMAAAIRELRSLPEGERELFGQRGRAAHLANYTRAVQVERIARALERAAGR